MVISPQKWYAGGEVMTILDRTDENACRLCPRMCGVDRRVDTGCCGCGPNVKLARAALHMWEEPCISGRRGSGTVFFSGCNLRCVYCQNRDISRGGVGKEVSERRLAEIFLELQQQGAHNINLVTATPYAHAVRRALNIARPTLNIPVVYNCGGYERVETIRALAGYVDVYLPDLKYMSGGLAQRYSGAADYFDAAAAAIAEMIAQTGGLRYDGDGMMMRGVIVRHLVLPGAHSDSIAILRWMSENLPKERYLLSLMSQYTPPADLAGFPELQRRVTSLEYDRVVREALRLGLTNGYMQRRDSAEAAYIPPFDLTGV
jgi:putative pyruvate formate lyase activating enzyme